MSDEAQPASSQKFNPYTANKENEELTGSPNFAERRTGRNRSKSLLYSEFQRRVPALMEYESLRRSEFKPQIAKTEALLTDVLAEADRVEATAKKLMDKVVKVQGTAIDERDSNRAAEKRIAEKQELLKKQVEEGRDLRKRLLHAKQRFEGLTKSRINGLPSSKKSHLLSNIPILIYHVDEDVKESEDSLSKGKRGRRKSANGTKPAAESSGEEFFSAGAKKQAKEGNVLANHFSVACNGLTTRLAMLRDELRNEAVAKRTASPTKKQKTVRPTKTPSPKKVRPPRSASASPTNSEKMSRLKSPRKEGTPFPSSHNFKDEFGSAYIFLESERGLGPRQPESFAETMSRPEDTEWPGDEEHMKRPLPHSLKKRKHVRKPRPGEPGYKRPPRQNRNPLTPPERFTGDEAGLKKDIHELEQALRSLNKKGAADTGVLSEARAVIEHAESATSGPGRRVSNVYFPHASLVESYQAKYKREGHHDQLGHAWHQRKSIVGRKSQASIVLSQKDMQRLQLLSPAVQDHSDSGSEGGEHGGDSDAQRRSRPSIVRFNLPDSPDSPSTSPSASPAQRKTIFDGDKDTF